MPYRKHYLYPGTLLADRQPHLVTTVLGSCVAVCFWDKKSGVGGINHFMLPFWNGKGLPTPKFGNVAIDKLLHKVRKLSDDSNEIVAKVFGGATMWGNVDGSFMVGERNIELARKMLKEERIKIVSIDVGGVQGRKIIFNTQTGKVLLKRNDGLARFSLKQAARDSSEFKDCLHISG